MTAGTKEYEVFLSYPITLYAMSCGQKRALVSAGRMPYQGRSCSCGAARGRDERERMCRGVMLPLAQHSTPLRR